MHTCELQLKPRVCFLKFNISKVQVYIFIYISPWQPTHKPTTCIPCTHIIYIQIHIYTYSSGLTCYDPIPNSLASDRITAFSGSDFGEMVEMKLGKMLMQLWH